MITPGLRFFLGCLIFGPRGFRLVCGLRQLSLAHLHKRVVS